MKKIITVFLILLLFGFKGISDTEWWGVNPTSTVEEVIGPICYPNFMPRRIIDTSITADDNVYYHFSYSESPTDNTGIYSNATIRLGSDRKTSNDEIYFGENAIVYFGNIDNIYVKDGTNDYMSAASIANNLLGIDTAPIKLSSVAQSKGIHFDCSSSNKTTQVYEWVSDDGKILSQVAPNFWRSESGTFGGYALQYSNNTWSFDHMYGGLGNVTLRISGNQNATSLTFSDITLTRSIISESTDGNIACGEYENGAIAIGRHAKAKIPSEVIDTFNNNTQVRSVSIAIGDYADALVTNSTKSQALAIGWHAQAKASNAIAIGMGAQHTYENAPESGDATYVGASDGIAIGYSAKVTAKSAVQIGVGINNEECTLKFRNYQLIDKDGQIPTNRLLAAFRQMSSDIDIDASKQIEQALQRAVKPGNMDIICNGTGDEYDEDVSQKIEPRLDGLSKISMLSNTNGEYECDTVAYMLPPLGSRNYDTLIENIPQYYSPTGIQLEQNNVLLLFNYLTETHNINIWCDPNIGYNNASSCNITNAPCIIKIREPATNLLYVVVKPWSFELL